MTDSLQDKQMGSIEALVKQALNAGVFPGVEVFLALDRKVHYHQVFGTFDREKKSPLLTKNALFDLASLTKPLATTFALLHLLDQGKLNLEDPVVKTLPEFDRKETRAITIRHLLTHTSGLPAWRPLCKPNFDRDQGLQQLFNLPLENKPGSKMVYSCLDFLLLGELISRISKSSLADYCQQNIYQPLGLRRTGFHPDQNQVDLVPTDYCAYRQQTLRGIVHDENSFLLGGDAGNAGLFSTAHEIHQLCCLIFDRGISRGKQILSKETVALLSQNHNAAPLIAHSLGWDYNPLVAGYQSCGQKMPVGSLGHLGFTGTSLWIDPQSKLCIIILSNRVNMGREIKMKEMRAFRPKIHDFLLSMIDSLGENS